MMVAGSQTVGGAVFQRTDESLSKITDVVKHGVVDPTVTSRHSLADASQAIAESRAVTRPARSSSCRAREA